MILNVSMVKCFKISSCHKECILSMIVSLIGLQKCGDTVLFSIIVKIIRDHLLSLPQLKLHYNKVKFIELIQSPLKQSKHLLELHSF